MPVSLRRPQAPRGKPRTKPQVRSPRAKADRHFVTALARGLEVLACFRSGDAMLGNGDLAERCGLPKSTVSRLSGTLERLGYLRYIDDVAKYRLGSATLGLGSTVLSGLGVRQLARPMMQEVADFSQSVVALGVRVGLGIIYVEVCRNKAAITLPLDVGSRVPLATTAIGRAYFAAAPGDEREAIVRQLRTDDEPAWQRHRRALDAAADQHRKIGCCSSFGDWQSDVNGIAIGFHPGGGLPIMALNCGGPSFSLPRAFLLDEVRPRLATVVRRLEDTLGHAGPQIKAPRRPPRR
ncbi:MAG TPA: IclR family transcriptional regulator [Kofleriaceae bacterium]|jgi:DNA-binding IclR family transcriptional regulator|nr:IclR family transcriptional regulator [Kofleriaceae bacterium]